MARVGQGEINTEKQAAKLTPQQQASIDLQTLVTQYQSWQQAFTDASTQWSLANAANKPAKQRAMNDAQKRRDDALAQLKAATAQYQTQYGDPPVVDVGVRRAVGLPDVPSAAMQAQLRRIESAQPAPSAAAAPAPAPAPTPTPAAPKPAAAAQGTSTNPQVVQVSSTPAAANLGSVDDQIRRNFGFMAWAIDDPEIGPLLHKAISEQWDTAMLQGALEQTSFWKTHTAVQTDWLRLQKTDPATVASRTAAVTAKITNLAGSLGINLAPDRLSALADQALASGWGSGLNGGWSDSQLQSAVAAEFHYQPGGQTGAIGAAEASIRSDAQQYGVSDLLGDAVMASYDAQIANGTATPDTIKQDIIKLAQQRFPAFAARITMDNPTANVLAPYRQLANQELGIDANSVDFSQPMWNRLVNQIDPKTGAPVPMSIYDAQRTIRSDEQYGWDKTQNGKTAYTQAALALTQALGVHP